MAALFTYVYAKKNGGFCFLRIDDLDSYRCKQKYISWTLKMLDTLGFNFDGKIYYQSKHLEEYNYYFSILKQKKMLYTCNCTRSMIKQHSKKGQNGYIYSGHCKNYGTNNNTNSSYRIKTYDKNFSFVDGEQGNLRQNLKKEIGDFVIKRKDGIFAYLFTNPVDDYLMKINHSIKGVDLIFSVASQQYIGNILSFPSISYSHFELVYENNIKLSKSSAAPPINMNKPLEVLINAFNLSTKEKIKHSDIDSIKDFWNFVI
jgi:glutamyl-Q tRNA(Asp) synthetase